MSEFNNALSPLRERMIEDMTMLSSSQKTQTASLRHFSELGKDLRSYQLNLNGSVQPSCGTNTRLIELRLFFAAVIDGVIVMKQINHVKEPRQIP